MKNRKKRIIFIPISLWIISLVIIIIPISLKWNEIKLEIIISIFSLWITLLAVSLSFIELNLTKIRQDENDYKKYLIAFLQEKLISLKNMFNNLILDLDAFVEVEVRRNSFGVIMLDCPVFKKYFNDAGQYFESVMQVPKQKTKDKYFEADELQKIKLRLIIFSNYLSNDINNKIIELYQGCLDVNNVNDVKFVYDVDNYLKEE